MAGLCGRDRAGQGLTPEGFRAVVAERKVARLPALSTARSPREGRDEGQPESPHGPNVVPAELGAK